MAKITSLRKAQVSAYDRQDTRTGKQVHVGEYTNKVQKRYTTEDAIAGLREHFKNVKELVERASQPKEDRPEETTAPQEEAQPKDQQQSKPSTQKQPQPLQQHSTQPPKVLTNSLLRIQNGVKINEIMVEFAHLPIAQQHVFDQWLVVSGHSASEQKGSTAQRFRGVLEDMRTKLKEHDRTKDKSVDEELLPKTAPIEPVMAAAQRREKDTSDFTTQAESYPVGSSFTVPVASDKTMVGTWKRVDIGGELFWQKGNRFKKTDAFAKQKESVVKQLEEGAKKAKEEEAKKKEAKAQKEKKNSKSVLVVSQSRKEKPEETPNVEDHGFMVPHLGKTESTYTDQGAKIGVQYALVESHHPIASHDTNFTKNPAFPEELQPRDRSRAASEGQVQSILANFQPELLGKNPKTSDGAPVVGPDGAVEVGNGRTIAIRRAYEQKGAEAEAYHNWLTSNAEDYGFSKDHVAALKQPMLVRMRQTNVNRADFVNETNKPSAAPYSASEQARSDAKFLTADSMMSFNPKSADGVLAAENRDFVRDFIGHLPTQEAGPLVTSTGVLSQVGQQRIGNALFHRAYGSKSLLEKTTESTDDATKNLTNALTAVAPRIASLKARMEAGDLHSVDLTSDVAKAALKFNALKSQGERVSDYLAQGDLLTSELSQTARGFLEAFDQHNKNPQIIRGMLSTYADYVEKGGNPRQGSFLGGSPKPTKEGALRAMIGALPAKGKELAASWARGARFLLELLNKAHVREHVSHSKEGKEFNVREHEDKRQAAILRAGDPHPLGLPHVPSTPEQRAVAAERGVKVPPVSWGLHVAADPQHKLQATWYDRTGKQQYGYHPEWSAAQSAKKFEDNKKMDEVVPQVEKQIAEDLQRADADPKRVAAAVVSLIHKAYIRVGSEKFAQEHETYGASSLRKNHVAIQHDGVSLNFIGKHAKEQSKRVVAPELVPVMQHLQTLPGDRMFQFHSKQGLTALTEQHVRDYLEPFGITPKSFRTYHATRLASELLARESAPGNDKEAQKTITQVVKEVSQHLGNTPAVCRANYINPAVLEEYAKRT